jgi:hypothetical protein
MHPLDVGLGPGVLELPLLSQGAHIAVARFQLLFLAVQDQPALSLERRAEHGRWHAVRAVRGTRLDRVFHNPDFLEARHVRGIFAEVLAHYPESDFAAFADRLGGELYGHRTMLLIVRHVQDRTSIVAMNLDMVGLLSLALETCQSHGHATRSASLHIRVKEVLTLLGKSKKRSST